MSEEGLIVNTWRASIESTASEFSGSTSYVKWVPRTHYIYVSVVSGSGVMMLRLKTSSPARTDPGKTS